MGRSKDKCCQLAHKYHRNSHPDGERDARVNDAPAQILKMIQKWHFPVFGVGGINCGVRRQERGSHMPAILSCFSRNTSSGGTLVSPEHIIVKRVHLVDNLSFVVAIKMVRSESDQPTDCG